MGRRQVVLVLLVAQLVLLLSRGEAQYGGPPFGEGGWGGGSFVPPPGLSRGGEGFPTGVNCSDLVCGLGSCNSTSSSSQNGSSYSYSYSYSYNGSLCSCKPGWIISPLEDPSQFYMNPYPYHPCVRPNCTLTPNCPFNVTRPRQPDPRNAPAWNDSCAWADCLGGSCVADGAFRYRCECYPGFQNLFNNTAFPCMSDCMLSEECKNMGVSFAANETVQSGGGEGGSGSGGSGGQGSGTGVAVVPGMLLGWMLLLVGVTLV